MLLSEENSDSRKEKMLLKLTFKYCQYANAIAHFVRYLKEIQIYD